MSNIWTYAGEAGKALGALVRPFEGTAPGLSFPALGIDVLRWTVARAGLTPAGEALPQAGEVVTLWRSGIRFFRGVARRPEQSDFTMAVTVEGPWAWLEKEPLSSAVTLDAASGGGAGVRATIGFVAQSMTVSLTTLVDRMVALGAPFTRGTIATTFACIPVTLNQGSFAQALTELVRLIGDMAVAFDYTGTGLPALNITRRKQSLTGSAAVVTLDAGNFSPGKLKITPVDELRVSQVRVPFLDRAEDGTRRNQEQKAGTYEAGHVLLMTASGEEMDTFLPEEKLDSYFLQTVATSGTAFKSWVLGQTGDVVNAAAVAGIPASSLPLLIGPATLSYATLSTNLPTMSKSVPIPPTSFTDESGNAVSTTGMRILLGDTLPDWLKDSFTVVPVKISGAIYYDFKWKDSSPPATYAKPAWWYSIGWSASDQEGFRGTSSDYTTWELFILNFEIRGFLINRLASGSTTIYKQPDYTFIAPPAGFAAGVLAARDHTPHRGTIGWRAEECGATRYAGKVINVSGADPAWASMMAMVQSEELDLETGETRLTLGPPARLDFPNLLDQTRTHSAQQIVYL